MGKPVLKMLLGGAAGLLVWIIFEPMMPSNPFSSVAAMVSERMVAWVGIAIGLVLGGFNGYQQGSRMHLVRGVLLGGVFGLVGVTAGAAVGYALSAPLGGGNTLLNSSVPMLAKIPVRILALAPIGLFLGAAVGASSLNWKRTIQGAIGGLIGGGIGAALFDPISVTLGPLALQMNQSHGQAVDTGPFSRALYCLFLGGFIGLFVGIIENASKVAWLRMALGRNEGREWVVDLPETVIGRSETANVPLFGDTGIAPKHATIHRRSDEYLLVDEGSQAGTFLNGQRISQSPLFHGAMIQVGGYQLEFLMKVGSAPQRAAEALRSQGHYAFQPVAPAAVPYAGPGSPVFQPGMAGPIAATASGPVFNPSMPQVATPANVSYAQSVPTQVVPAQPAAGLQPPTDSLVAISGPLTGQRFPVSGNLEIGRESPGVGLSFDTSASRRHAGISSTPSGLIVTDLGSTNGTFVNDQKVQAASLVKGDLLRIGITTFRVE